ncbi:hypothetical protein AN216_22300 [Streptomyces oceani]|uniref:Uncharacterized protein n=1 Tax=Streptomyces oceani TaxID=1075402 RepID=A0A1E7JWN9_9ACTN|nr:hypothetical protein AN216_22300 [Streptomyces oceani]
MGSTVGRDEGVLNRVGRFIAVAERPYGHGPQAVPVPADKLVERVRVAVDMALQKLPVADCGDLPRGGRGLSVRGHRSHPFYAYPGIRWSLPT